MISGTKLYVVSGPKRVSNSVTWILEAKEETALCLVYTNFRAHVQNSIVLNDFWNKVVCTTLLSPSIVLNDFWDKVILIKEETALCLVYTNFLAHVQNSIVLNDFWNKVVCMTLSSPTKMLNLRTWESSNMRTFKFSIVPTYSQALKLSPLVVGSSNIHISQRQVTPSGPSIYWTKQPIATQKRNLYMSGRVFVNQVRTDDQAHQYIGPNNPSRPKKEIRTFLTAFLYTNGSTRAWVDKYQTT
ncbi:hypothetical protein GGX14DRAFT_404913 [Mycena pura]|uniref:Uncharacterized protein n=1 Tax=Mycena pura TaxID=153505 RepID=A0AAD6V056_9AGAR|nr:hypothetical protein GGX14DRAFT_404913 [Mycena pura]